MARDRSQSPSAWSASPVLVALAALALLIVAGLMSLHLMPNGTPTGSSKVQGKPAPMSGSPTPTPAPLWGYEVDASRARYIAMVKVVAVGTPRANTEPGIAPTRPPGLRIGGSLPSPDKDLWVELVFDVVDPIKGFDVPNPPVGFAVLEYSSSVDDFGGFDGEPDRMMHFIDLDGLQPGDNGVLFLEDGPPYPSGPIVQLVHAQADELSSQGRKFEWSVRPRAWFRYSDGAATRLGYSRSAPTQSIPVTELEDFLDSLFPGS
jgi:hypothetical protein